MVNVVESYRDWAPPIAVGPVVRRLLKGTPSRFQIALGSVVLTNASGLSHDRRRRKTGSRGHKVAIRDCLGLYHRERRGEPAWIELFLDNILSSWQPSLLRIPLVQEALVGDVLFHELGHHLHATQAPEHREREDVAERWQRKLLRRYAWRCYWYVLPLLYPIFFAMKLWRTARRRLRRHQNQPR